MIATISLDRNKSISKIVETLLSHTYNYSKINENLGELRSMKGEIILLHPQTFQILRDFVDKIPILKEPKF